MKSKMFFAISNLFGKFRHRGYTRFTDVEKRARNTIYLYVHRKIDDEQMFNDMSEIRKEFYRLTNVNDNIVIDKDTPLWMNKFFGFKFHDWAKFQMLKKHFKEHPEELIGETKKSYERICEMGYNEDFIAACKYILKNFGGSEYSV